ncbi:hypothetical protein TcWFU_003735 [Taenia crassiceps]|uniref:Uncharacterized protein n=1 Tax=Taenia crassiceps TaxID=6207 RepID=A0ABR4QAR8_9CEST
MVKQACGDNCIFIKLHFYVAFKNLRGLTFASPFIGVWSFAGGIIVHREAATADVKLTVTDHLPAAQRPESSVVAAVGQELTEKGPHLLDGEQHTNVVMTMMRRRRMDINMGNIEDHIENEPGHANTKDNNAKESNTKESNDHDGIKDDEEKCGDEKYNHDKKRGTIKANVGVSREDNGDNGENDDNEKDFDNVDELLKAENGRKEVKEKSHRR